MHHSLFNAVPANSKHRKLFLSYPTDTVYRLAAEQQERLEQESRQMLVGRREREEEEKERLKMELEERIWKEAEESLRQEFESHMHRERENLQHQVGDSAVVKVMWVQLSFSLINCHDCCLCGQIPIRELYHIAVYTAIQSDCREADLYLLRDVTYAMSAKRRKWTDFLASKPEHLLSSN